MTTTLATRRSGAARTWLRGLAACAALAAAAAAHAGDVRWSIGINLPAPPIFHHGPVYAPAPVYYGPPVYASTYRYNDGHRGYRGDRRWHHDRYHGRPAVIVQPRHWGHPHRYHGRPPARHVEHWHRGDRHERGRGDDRRGGRGRD